MSALISILRAVHCRSTHHFFAIDALDRINTPNGRRLASVLLANYAEYLDGAKAPDTKFKDFQNHVLHVSDNYWGGATQACEKWLAQIIVDMHESDWRKAAYDIGVLSHYFTDPLMPLHTAQHPSEAVVHRPLEWSVCKTYDRIFRKCTGQVQFPIATGPQWISQAVTAGAEIAHQHYQTLIELYDLKKGAKDPPAGFDSRSREILTVIFDYVLTGWANILDRIAALALVEIPICPLTFTTIMAAVDVPAKYVVGRIADASEQRAVQAIFDEFQATGKVVRNLSPELKAIESLKPTPKPTTEKTSPVQPLVQEPLPTKEPELKPSPQPIPQPELPPAPPPVPAEEPVLAEPQPAELQRVEPQPLIASREMEPEEAIESPQTESVDPETRPAKSIVPAPHTAPTQATRSRLQLDSDIVDAPSIGPKTAARFYAIGINTIGDFLSANAAEMAAALNAKWMDESVLLDWQSQTQLVLEVPALCGYKAQLLVGIGCNTTEVLAGADPEVLHQYLSQYAASDAGQRILRSATVPTMEEVAKWIDSAQAVEPNSTNVPHANEHGSAR